MEPASDGGHRRHDRQPLHVDSESYVDGQGYVDNERQMRTSAPLAGKGAVSRYEG
jgi:hypothetical protein